VYCSPFVVFWLAMRITGHTVLVTGGASGIGFAMAQRFLAEGNTVIICGRREDKLREARGLLPGLATRVSDLADPLQRIELAAWAVKQFPSLDVLVNNAGIQRRLSLLQTLEWDELHTELAINLEAPIHLSTLLVPHLRKMPQPAVINVSSGLAYVPLAITPIYSATKAAIHSYTLSLRHQLAPHVEVIEIAPPAVNTDLGGPGLHTWGVPLDEFADAAFAQLRSGSTEISYGFSEDAKQATAEGRHEMFERMNKR